MTSAAQIWPVSISHSSGQMGGLFNVHDIVEYVLYFFKHGKVTHHSESFMNRFVPFLWVVHSPERRLAIRDPKLDLFD